MYGPPGFYCFFHEFKDGRGENRRYAFAYMPPGPLRHGALDELMLGVCKGPLIPDAVVIVGFSNVTSHAPVWKALESEPGKVAQERLRERIPLVTVRVDLVSGAIDVGLLDNFFGSRFGELQCELRKSRSWVNSGLSALFNPEQVVLRAPAGYAYEKPSGARSEIFLKPDLAFTTSAAVSFVAFALFQKLYSGKNKNFDSLGSVFLDTMAIAPVAYSLRDVLNACGYSGSFNIESFHSYGGFEDVRRPLPGTSICLISASASMSLHEQWLLHKGGSHDEVVTLLTLTSARKLLDGALFALDLPLGDTAPSAAKFSIKIRGETFFPEQESAKKVLLRDTYHRDDKAVDLFYRFAGRGVFDVYRRPLKSGVKARALYVDAVRLTSQAEFSSWLEDRLVQSVKASTRVIIHQGDVGSIALAKTVKCFCENHLGLSGLQLVPAESLPEGVGRTAGVVVCAAVVGKGSQLLEISRSLRDVHTGPRLYVIGYQVAESLSELKGLVDNLRHSKSVPYEIARFGQAAVGTQLIASFERERRHYYDSSRDLSGLPARMRRRAQKLGGTEAIGDLCLLPHGSTLNDSMRLRSGFAFWPVDFIAGAHHAEALATIAVLLQRAREGEGLSDIHRLSTASYRHVVLDPENFTRFNDGILQAALLRCAYPSELDYRADYSASDFMKSLVIRSINRSEAEAGEAVLEFLSALAVGKLQLVNVHFQEVFNVAKSSVVKSRNLRRAIRFLLDPDANGKGVGSKLPF